MAISVTWNGAGGRVATGNIGTETWAALRFYGSGNAGAVSAADGALQGSNAATCTVNNKGVLLYVDLGAAGTLDFSVGGANEGEFVYIWGNFLASALLDTYAGATSSIGGFGVYMGSSAPSTSVYRVWSFYGNDNYTGGWKRMAVDPTTTPSATAGAWDNTAVRYIGLFAITLNTARFDNLICDAIDVGTGITVDGTTTASGLFTDILGNETTNRYGIVTSINDSNTAFEINGKLLLGDVGGTASTLADEDSKVFASQQIYYNAGDAASIPTSALGIDVVGSAGIQSLAFGQIVGTTGGRNGVSIVGNDTYNFSIDFSDGNVETNKWYGCSLENLGGTLSFDSSTHEFRGNNVIGCSGMSFVTGSTATDCSFISSGIVALAGTASLSNCVVTESTGVAAVSTNDLANLDGCSFTKGTSGHAVQLDITGSSTMNWNCTLSGYDTGTTGTPVTATNTSDSAILVNADTTGRTLTINVADGATIPSIKIGTNSPTVNVTAGQRTFTVTVRDINTSSALQNARVYVTAAAGGGLTEGTVIIDKALTNASGVVDDTRSYSSDQPYTGSVRLASSGVFYKATTISGTISSSANTSITVSLIPDD